MDAKTMSRIAVVASGASLLLSAAALYESTNNSPQFTRAVDSVDVDLQGSDVSYNARGGEEVVSQIAARSSPVPSTQAALISGTEVQAMRGSQTLAAGQPRVASTTTSQVRNVSLRNGEMVINIGEFRDVDTIDNDTDANTKVVNLGPNLDPDDLADHPESVGPIRNIGAKENARLE